jgi:hypothetical protein
VAVGAIGAVGDHRSRAGEEPAMIVPTSAATAVMLDFPVWADSVLGFLVPALFAAGLYCAWEMLLSTIVGRRPPRSRWVALVAATAFVVSGMLAELFLTAVFRFNADGETLWGYVLSPWFILAFVVCAVLLVAYRVADAQKAGPFASVPAVVWWTAGCLVVSAYGVGTAWVGGGSIVGADYVTPLLAAGFALGMTGIGSLAIAAELRRSRAATAVRVAHRV